MKKVIIIPLLALGLVACQADSTETPVKNETNETNAIIENESNENQEVNESNSVNNEVEQVDLDLYDDVIDNYANFTEMTQEEAENANLGYVKKGAYGLFYDSYIFEGISATYYDINDDGVEELLIALRVDQDSYVPIDLHTIVDGEVIPLFTDEISEGILFKNSNTILLDNGDVVYTTANGRGDRFGSIYELKEETMEYVEAYEVSIEEGDFSVIEKELENTLDINTFDWKPIDKEKESTVYDEFMDGDFSALEGIWESGYDQVRIEGNDFFNEDGSRLIIDHPQEYDDEEAIGFSIMSEDGIGGAALVFYPENIDLEFRDELVPSDTKRHRFFITQSDPPEEKAIYYKVSD